MTLLEKPDQLPEMPRSRPRRTISSARLLAAARKRFGIRSFRPGQQRLIDAVLQGRNAIGILPTGAGKSLCFQLPALFLDGTVLVVSPLIALMQDQIAHLDAAGIDAVRIDSSVPAAERAARENLVKAGLKNVVLMSPERLADPEHLKPLLGCVDLMVIDEAHCISQWGHDFRPAYLHLREVIKKLGNPPVLALTATAPAAVQEEIKTSLGLRQLDVIQTTIDRPNLFLKVMHTVNEEEKEAELLLRLASVSGSAIVYVSTVKEVDKLHARLVECEIHAERYHGRMTKKAREDAQIKFMKNDRAIIIATNAFGLGIDKPSVRLVLHWNFPGSLESYYQEAGRAGRDGCPAECTLLFRLEDKRIRSFFLGSNKPHKRDLGSLLDVFLDGKEAAAWTLKELAVASGLGERRVSTLCAALIDLEVLTRVGRKLAFAQTPETQDLEAFVGIRRLPHAVFAWLLR